MFGRSARGGDYEHLRRGAGGEDAGTRPIAAFASHRLLIAFICAGDAFWSCFCSPTERMNVVAGESMNSQSQILFMPAHGTPSLEAIKKSVMWLAANGVIEASPKQWATVIVSPRTVRRFLAARE